jgi:hypothetical protein
VTYIQVFTSFVHSNELLFKCSQLAMLGGQDADELSLGVVAEHRRQGLLVDRAFV